MRNGFIAHTAGGALGGVLGTLFMQRGVPQIARRLPEKLSPTTPRRDPGHFMVTRLEQMRGRPLPQELHDRLATAMHWGYGIAWGALLGLATSRVHVQTVPRALLVGGGLGVAVWTVGFVGWLPATRLTPPVQRQGVRHAVAALAGHVAYGVLSALPLLLIDSRKTRRARSPWARALRALRR